MIELRGKQSELKVEFLLWSRKLLEVIMHNILSHNQLAGWKQSVMRLENTLDRSMEESDLINDYYNCLIECDDDQSTCKRICRRILR